VFVLPTTLRRLSFFQILTQRLLTVRWADVFADFRPDFEFFAKKLFLYLIFRPLRVDL